MHSKWVFKHSYPHASRRNFLLGSLWVVGLLIGVLLCALAPYDTGSILYGTVYTKPSLWGLFLVCVLPVAFSAIAVCSPLFLIAYVLVFLSAVSLGFCGTAIFVAVGSAAWIVRPMLLFSAGCTSVLMWWLLLKGNGRSRLKRPVCLALCLSCLVYIVDLFLISPFIGDLTKVL